MLFLVFGKITVCRKESETHLTLECLVICPAVMEFQRALYPKGLFTCCALVSVLVVNFVPAVLVRNMLLQALLTAEQLCAFLTFK